MNIRANHSELPNAGALVRGNASHLFEVSLAGERRFAHVGCNAALIPGLLAFAEEIIARDYAGRPSYGGEVILAEIAARLRNGIDSHTAGHTMLALVLLYLDLEGWLDKPVHAARRQALRLDIDRDGAWHARISRASFEEMAATLPSIDGSPRVIWQSPDTASDKDLRVLITDDAKTMSQALTIPYGGAKRLIRKAEKEMAKIPPAQHFGYALSMPIALIDYYRQSQEGAVEGLPASRWDWISTRDIAAGLIAWLLRREGMLDEAVRNAEHGFVRIIVRDDGSLDISFQSDLAE